MPKRFTDSEKWEDPWFRKLTPHGKLMILYLYDKCDIAGFWEIDLEAAAFKIGISNDEALGAIKEVERAYETNGDYIWITRFVHFQGNKDLDNKNRAHRGIIRLLTEREGFSDNVSRVLNRQDLPSSFNGASKGLFSPTSNSKGKGKGISTGSTKELPNVTSENEPLEKVLGRLNELRKTSWKWSSYKPLTSKRKTNTEHITALLNDGSTADELIVVLEYLAVKNKGHEESRQYFNCVTPFRPKHWENNLAMAADWDAKGRPSLKPSGNGSSRRVVTRPGEYDDVFEEA